MQVIRKEHESIGRLDLNSHLWQSIFNRLVGKRNTDNLELIDLLGLKYDIQNDAFIANYYIGSAWIDKSKDCSLVITPKYDGLDFMKMFMTCFKNKDIGNYVEKLFYINVNDKPIPIPQDQFEIEPLTIAYFINLVSEIVNQGHHTWAILPKNSLYSYRSMLNLHNSSQ